MMSKFKNQTKRVSKKVVIGICLFCLIVAVAILGLSANSHTTQLNQFGLKNYPDAVKAVPTTLVKPDTVTQARVNKSYGKLPLSFEVNEGQADKKVKFLSRAGGSTLFLTPTEAVFVLNRMQNEKTLVSTLKSRIQKSDSANPKSGPRNPQSTVLHM